MWNDDDSKFFKLWNRFIEDTGKPTKDGWGYPIDQQDYIDEFVDWAYMKKVNGGELKAINHMDKYVDNKLATMQF